MIIDVQPYALILSYGVPAILFLSIIVAGFLTLYARRAKLSDRLEFAGEFRNRFVKYCNSEGQDTETYNWLILNCNKMQTQMGKYGVYRAFRPPYENYIINNYPIVLNMIPEVRKWYDESGKNFGLRFGSMAEQYVKAVDEAMLRYIGSMSNTFEDVDNKLRNPLQWFKFGVEQILSIPFIMLVSFQIVNDSFLENFRSSILFKIVSLCSTIVAAISGIMTIVLGWENFLDLIKNYW